MRRTFAVGLLTVILVATVARAQVVVDEVIEAAVGELVSGEEGVDTGRAFRRIESRPGGKVGAVYRLVEIAGSTDPARGARAKWAVWCVAGPDGYHAVFDRVQRWERAEEVVRQVGGLVPQPRLPYPALRGRAQRPASTLGQARLPERLPGGCEGRQNSACRQADAHRPAWRAELPAAHRDGLSLTPELPRPGHHQSLWRARPPARASCPLQARPELGAARRDIRRFPGGP